MKRTLALLAVFALAGALTGCGGLRSMTLDEARSLCFTQTGGGGVERDGDYDGGGACSEVRVICEEYLDRARMADIPRDQCVASCMRTRDAMRQRHLTDGCWLEADRAFDLCSQYCRGR